MTESLDVARLSVIFMLVMKMRHENTKYLKLTYKTEDLLFEVADDVQFLFSCENHDGSFFHVIYWGY